jgi:hypothetical protein
MQIKERVEKGITNNHRGGIKDVPHAKFDS